MSKDLNILTTTESLHYVAHLTEEQCETVLKMHTTPRIDTTAQEQLKAIVTLGLIRLQADVNPLTGIVLERLEADLAEAVDKANTAKTKPTVNKYREQATELRKALNLVPSVWMSREEDRQEGKTESLQTVLQGYLDEADRQTAKAAEAVAAGGWQAMNVFEWGDRVVEAVAIARKVSEVFAAVEAYPEITLREAVQEIIKEMTEVLVNNSLRGASTNDFSNATENATRAAYANFISRMRWML